MSWIFPSGLMFRHWFGQISIQDFCGRFSQIARFFSSFSAKIRGEEYGCSYLSHEINPGLLKVKTRVSTQHLFPPIDANSTNISCSFVKFVAKNPGPAFSTATKRSPRSVTPSIDNSKRLFYNQARSKYCSLLP